MSSSMYDEFGDADEDWFSQNNFGTSAYDNTPYVFEEHSSPIEGDIHGSDLHSLDVPLRPTSAPPSPPSHVLDGPSYEDASLSVPMHDTALMSAPQLSPMNYPDQPSTSGVTYSDLQPVVGDIEYETDAATPQPSHQEAIQTVNGHYVSGSTQQVYYQETLPQQSHSQPQIVYVQQPSSLKSSNSQPTRSKQRPPPQSSSNRISSSRRRNGPSQANSVRTVLTNANKQSSASMPSEVRISVEGLQQVSSISAEISMLEEEQKRGIDHSRRIEELTQKRASIFIEALKQQHNLEVTVSEPVSQPQANIGTRPSASRTRGYNHRSGETSPTYQPQYLHSSFPSTSFATNDYAQPSQPQKRYYKVVGVDDFAKQKQVAQPYPAPPGANTVYVQAQPSQRVSSYDGQVVYRQEMQAPVIVRGENSYGNQPAPRFVQIAPVQTPQTVPVQHSSTNIQPLQAGVLLRPAAQSARRIEEKRAMRKAKLREHLGALSNRLMVSSTETPFTGQLDAMLRLLPFHVYYEPELSTEALEDFDTLYIRKSIELQEEKQKLFRRLRTALYKEAVHGTEEYEKAALSFLDGEYERRALEDDRKAAAEDLHSFVRNSEYCARFKARPPRESETPQKLLEALPTHAGPRYASHFDYHPFEERTSLSPLSSIHSSPIKSPERPSPVKSPTRPSPITSPIKSPSPQKSPTKAAAPKRLIPSWAKHRHLPPQNFPTGLTTSHQLPSARSPVASAVPPQLHQKPSHPSPPGSARRASLSSHPSISMAEANLEDSASDRSCSPELSVYDLPPVPVPMLPSKERQVKVEEAPRGSLKLVIHRSRLIKPEETLNGKHHRHRHHKKHKKHKKHKREKKRTAVVNGDEHPRERLVMRIKRSALLPSRNDDGDDEEEPEPEPEVEPTPKKVPKLKIILGKRPEPMAILTEQSKVDVQKEGVRMEEVNKKTNYDFPWNPADNSILLAAGRSTFPGMLGTSSNDITTSVTASNLQFSPQNEDSDSDHERLIGAADKVLDKLGFWPSQQSSWLPNQHA